MFRFQQNEVHSPGGATLSIHVSQLSIELHNCHFTQNRAVEGFGGGLAVAGPPTSSNYDPNRDLDGHRSDVTLRRVVMLGNEVCLHLFCNQSAETDLLMNTHKNVGS